MGCIFAAFAVTGGYDTGFRDWTDICPIRCHIPGMTVLLRGFPKNKLAHTDITLAIRLRN